MNDAYTCGYISMYVYIYTIVTTKSMPIAFFWVPPTLFPFFFFLASKFDYTHWTTQNVLVNLRHILFSIIVFVLQLFIGLWFKICQYMSCSNDIYSYGMLTYQRAGHIIKMHFYVIVECVFAFYFPGTQMFRKSKFTVTRKLFSEQSCEPHPSGLTCALVKVLYK